MMSPETRQLSGELIKEFGGLSAAVAHLLCVTDVLRDVERRGPDVGVFAQVNERFFFFIRFVVFFGAVLSVAMEIGCY